MVKNATDTPLPQGWHIVRLGDVARIEFSSVDKKSIDGEIPVKLCNYTDVLYNRRILGNMQFMTATARPRELKRWGLKRGDVLFTKDSETRTEIGIPAYITEDLPNVLCGYHLGRARARPEVVEGSYLARAFLSTRLSKQLAQIANGVTRFGLTLGATSAIELLVPPIGEQKAISEVLDSIDDAIEHTERTVVATKALRDALLHELLTKGLPGWHTEWQEHPTYGTIPAAWTIVRLEEIADVVGGSTPARSEPTFWDGPLPWVVPSEISQLRCRYLHDTKDTITQIGAKSAGCKVLPVGSVLLTTRATIGTAAICAVPTTTNQGFQSLVPRKGTDSLWLFYRVRALTHQFMRRAAGSTFREVSRQSVRGVPLPFPSLREQQAIANVLDAVDNVIEQTRGENTTLTAFKESASDALLTGRVRVPGYA